MCKPKFDITNIINNLLVHIEKVSGFFDAAILSNGWVSDMQKIRR